jgi:hypothetical protein
VTVLAKEVADLFRNTLRLNLKMAKAKAEKAGGRISSLVSDSEDDPLEPEELTTLSPSELSYWMAHVFAVSTRVLDVDLTAPISHALALVCHIRLRFLNVYGNTSMRVGQRK